MVTATETENVADVLYEGMFLLDSGKFSSDSEGVTQHLLDMLAKAGATVVTHRPWLDGRLAYEIAGERRGVHYVVYFRMPGRGIEEITRSCKLSELVMRHLVIRHEQVMFNAMVDALNVNDAAEADSAEASSADEKKTDEKPAGEKTKSAAATTSDK